MRNEKGQIKINKYAPLGLIINEDRQGAKWGWAGAKKRGEGGGGDDFTRNETG